MIGPAATVRCPIQGAPPITASNSFGAITASHANIFVPSTVDVDAFNHAARLFRVAGSSRIFLWWQCGARNEDGGGTFIRGVYSDDDGATWSSPASIVPAFEAVDVTGTIDNHIAAMIGVVSANGRTFVIGEIQFVTWAAGLQTGRTNIGLVAMEVTGGTWTAFKWINGSGLGLDSWSGRDLSLLFTLLSSPGYAFASLNVFHYPKIYGTEMVIESFSFLTTTGCWLRIGRGYNVAAQVSLSSFIYTQMSCDGIVWSPETVSAVANAPSLIEGIKLSNGKYAILWNPDSDRNKLVAAVGTDGINFPTAYSVRSGLGTTPVFSGAYKGGGPQYPSTIERSDGKLLIAYSVFKENIAVSVVTVP